MKNRLIAALLCVALLPQGFAQTLPELGDSASADLSPLAEQRLGAQIMREIRWRDPAYLRDLEVEDYLNHLGGRLVAVSEPSREYLWVLSRTPEVDAQAYQRLVERLAARGFEVGKLERSGLTAR